MFYGLHLTKKEERDKLRETEFTLIDIPPSVLHRHEGYRPIIWDEDSGDYYQHSFKEFMETLDLIDKGVNYDIKDTPYYHRWSYKGDEILTRLSNLKTLYKSIQEEGIHEPVCVEQTGERLDGAFRTKIAIHLGIPTVKAKLFKLNWQDVSEELIERKLRGRWLSSGKDYYEFEFGYKNWKNVLEGGHVYKENALDRWKVLETLITGKTVIDLGCNEGYMSLQCARRGMKVYGYDIDLIHVANLNKLIYEWIERRDLYVSFFEKDITEVEYPKSDVVLMLNVLYHIPRDKQVPLLKKFLGRKVVLQCNLRKSHEREAYYGSHPDDAYNLLKSAGFKSIQTIEWRDKPILIA